MARFALIDTGTNTVIELRNYAVQPPDPAGKPRKWLPCPIAAQPSVDPTSEAVVGPTYTVNVDDVTEAWAKRSLTAQEIDSAKQAAIGSLNGTWQPVLKAFYNVDSRLRVLEGKNAITFQQFKSGLANQVL